MIYKNRFYPLDTAVIISTSYKDMMGMKGIESVEIVKYRRLTGVFGDKIDWVGETTLDYFNETYISLQDERDEKLRKLGI